MEGAVRHGAGIDQLLAERPDLQAADHVRHLVEGRVAPLEGAAHLRLGVGALVDIIMIATESFTDDTGRVIVQDSKKIPNRAYAGAQSASSDVYEQLARLSSLRASGAISQEEYDAKKAVLLEKIK